MATNGQIDCTTGTFVTSWGSVSGACWYNSFPAQFFNPSGYWSQVESCSGASECTYSVEYGVTSTTEDATSASWSQTLTDSTETGMEFAKETLTTSVSTSVTQSQSQAYSVSVTKGCSVTCPGDTVVWQWMMDTNEVNFGASTAAMQTPFTTYSCNYLCSNTSQVPLCPPGYCEPDTNCQKCTQDVFVN
eukprot:CAMPEP_0201516600 /NCGR_PEP_ID=MMETSP0161_2-20130828/7898_1 /ASSEMBLY_ACC=CAM_ASM_000251 /TAXON_ID=180227 /ORGANISM="Neoparamoeba aestuarina, Strain SoJaBio B1-5/56/2" /LENGTH=188 /DNA_ID=CAMNT_0047913795 /DNA_START=87 /DNA_END=653 /DNA_ORIENTATION=+